ncbi:hypothetical protein Taro_031914 [Colocasia esculenta]|uniref:Uncharacterized protein n=1 Tax=Colocasia esculenta TaxID=4460 RepID=A0A843VTB9_COLES|nr:hypothetical protein [Colocasia esculenta]
MPTKTPEADRVLSRPPKLSRYHHDGQDHRNNTQVGSGKRAVITNLSRKETRSRHDPYRDSQLCRDKVTSDRGDASSDVATRPAVATSAGRLTDGILHPGVAHTTTITQTRGGDHGESSKHKNSTKWTPNPHQEERAQESLPENEEPTNKGAFTRPRPPPPRSTTPLPSFTRAADATKLQPPERGKLSPSERRKERRKGKKGKEEAGQGF